MPDYNRPTPPPLAAYRVDEAVSIAGIGRTKLYEEIGAGRLRARKLGRRTLILREDLSAWLASLPQQPGVAA